MNMASALIQNLKTPMLTLAIITILNSICKLILSLSLLPLFLLFWLLFAFSFATNDARKKEIPIRFRMLLTWTLNQEYVIPWNILSHTRLTKQIPKTRKKAKIWMEGFKAELVSQKHSLIIHIISDSVKICDKYSCQFIKITLIKES